MTEITCPSCKGEYFTASPAHVKCPYCGYSSKETDEEFRARIDKWNRETYEAMTKEADRRKG